MLHIVSRCAKILVCKYNGILDAVNTHNVPTITFYSYNILVITE